MQRFRQQRSNRRGAHAERDDEQGRIERVVIAGGGTGGHLFPGIAVVEELRRRWPNVEVLFVGSPIGMEARVLPQTGERLEFIDVKPLKGRDLLGSARNASHLPSALWAARRILRRERPDLVIGLGGYAAGPMLLAAALSGTPTALLEQNAHLGLTNRLLAPLVGRAYLTFAETSHGFMPGRSRVVGNPVRRAFVDAARRTLADPAGSQARARQVLVLGGSQGAQALNLAVPEALAKAGLANSGVPVLHQAGQDMVTEVARAYVRLGIAARVEPFIEQMATAYGASTLVVSRAGATTVAELCAMGRPAVLVPYPHAADDHQTKNARVLEHAGAAVLVPQAELAERLASTLVELISDEARRAAMTSAMLKLGRPEAAATIVDDLSEWLGCDPDHWDQGPDRAGDAAAPGEAPQAPRKPGGTSREQRSSQPALANRWVSPYRVMQQQAPRTAALGGPTRLHSTRPRRPLVAVADSA